MNCWPSGKYVNLLCMHSILGRSSFSLITLIRRGMEVISLWHCWGGVKPRFLWLWPLAHLHFFGLLFLHLVKRHTFIFRNANCYWPFQISQILMLLFESSQKVTYCSFQQTWDKSKCKSAFFLLSDFTCLRKCLKIILNLTLEHCKSEDFCFRVLCMGNWFIL